jgi:hypothetical protein
MYQGLADQQSLLIAMLRPEFGHPQEHHAHTDPTEDASMAAAAAAAAAAAVAHLSKRAST